LKTYVYGRSWGFGREIRMLLQEACPFPSQGHILTTIANDRRDIHNHHHDDGHHHSGHDHGLYSLGFHPLPLLAELANDRGFSVFRKFMVMLKARRVGRHKPRILSSSGAGLSLVKTRASLIRLTFRAAGPDTFRP
jgi:hypothetical protein